MDPNANLREQLNLARDIQNTWDDCSGDGTLTHGQSEYVAEQAQRIAELVIELNEWIAKGGFLPAVWSKGGAR